MSPSNEPGSAPLPDAPIKTAGAGSKGLTPRGAGWPPPRGKAWKPARYPWLASQPSEDGASNGTVKAIISAISPMAMFHCRLDLIFGRTTAIVEMRFMIMLPQTQAAGKIAWGSSWAKADLFSLLSQSLRMP